MTIVIKTQSGNLVFNPKNIYICVNDQVFELKNIVGEGSDDNDFLGAYKTKERAEQLIEEIFKSLEFAGSHKEYVGCPVATFGMPKE